MVAAISARVGEECNRVLGLDLLEDEGKLREDPAWATKVEELAARQRERRLYVRGQHHVGAHLADGERREVRRGASGSASSAIIEFPPVFGNLN